MLVTVPDDPMSIFEYGKLKPGKYKVQNLTSQTYLEVQNDSRRLCCRPDRVLSPWGGLWEFKSTDSGYTIKKVESGKPDQYCNAVEWGLFGFGNPVSATAYPAAWRVELVNDLKFQGFGYVRIFWGSSNKALDLTWWGSSNDGTSVTLWENIDPAPWRIWKLLPVQEERPSTDKKDEAPPQYCTK